MLCSTTKGVKTVSRERRTGGGRSKRRQDVSVPFYSVRAFAIR